MKDITSISQGEDGDLTILDADTPKAGNVLQIQLGDLEYAPDFGIDIEFFLDEQLAFQNDTFKSYLVQRLAEHRVNVTQVLDVLQEFERNLTFMVGNVEPVSGGMIR